MSAPRESPGPWHGIPRAPFVLRTFPPHSGGNPKYGRGEGMSAGSLCDAGLMRRAPETGPPTLRHGPPDLAPDCRSGEGRRRRSHRRCDSARWLVALSMPFCLRFLT